jgi:hypothetical protein
MKATVLSAITVLMAGTLFGAESGPKAEVTAAAKMLAEKANYSWKTTVTVPEGSQFRPGPTEGKTAKDGVSVIKMTFGENTTEAVVQGEKGAMTNRDGEWQSLAEMNNAEGPGRFRGAMIRNFKAPAAQAADIVNGTKELKKDGDAYVGELTEEGAKSLLQFGRGGGGANVSNAKGSAKFWVKDGVLAKMEYKVQGTVSFNNNDRDVDRTTTVEIKDVGTTKVEIPAGAKSKLN